MDEAEKEIQAILEKYKLIYGYEVSFSQYNILPDEVKLAILILQKHSMKINFILKPQSKK